MKKIKTIFLIAIGLFIFQLGSTAQDLVYKPKNPAFGGDTFNYQWLQSSADAQNEYQEDLGFGLDDGSDIDQFEENLNRQLLNQISRELFQDQFGEEGLKPGSFVFGSLSLDIVPTVDGLSINILDTNTGETTNIVVPFP